MVQVVALVFAGIFLLFGGIVLSRAGELGDRSETISELASAGDEPVEPGGEATVSGPVHVLEPTSPTRTGPQPNGGDSAALWAWRVRRKENAPNGTRWRTAEAELAIGEFAIDHSWDRVAWTRRRWRPTRTTTPSTRRNCFWASRRRSPISGPRPGQSLPRADGIGERGRRH